MNQFKDKQDYLDRNRPLSIIQIGDEVMLTMTVGQAEQFGLPIGGKINKEDFERMSKQLKSAVKKG